MAALILMYVHWHLRTEMLSIFHVLLCILIDAVLFCVWREPDVPTSVAGLQSHAKTRGGVVRPGEQLNKDPQYQAGH